MTLTWDLVEEFINEPYPDHKIVGCVLADDSGSFAPTAVGTAYYDNIQCYDRIPEDAADVSPGPSGF